MRSAKVLIAVFTGRGGGLSSINHNLFLANPCFSIFPCVPNCIYMVLLDDCSRRKVYNVFTEVNIDEVSILEESKWVCHHELLLET
jgi:hypothetical protein